MTHSHHVGRMALGGSICGTFAGSFAGVLLGIVFGLFAGEGSAGFVGLDAALLGAALGSLVGAVCGVRLGLTGVADITHADRLSRFQMDGHFIQLDDDHGVGVELKLVDAELGHAGHEHGARPAQCIDNELGRKTTPFERAKR